MFGRFHRHLLPHNAPIKVTSQQHLKAALGDQIPSSWSRTCTTTWYESLTHLAPVWNPCENARQGEKLWVFQREDRIEKRDRDVMVHKTWTD
jgi:hypothetical protein